MRRRTRWVLGAVAGMVAVAGWWYLVPTSVFFTSSGRHHQEFDTNGVQHVVLRSSKDISDITVDHIPSHTVAVEGVVTLSIEGYHGSRLAAGVWPISREATELDVTVDDGVMTVSTRERINFHHSVFYDEILVQVPEGLPFTASQYSSNDLITNWYRE